MADPGGNWRLNIIWFAKFNLHVATYFFAFLMAYELRRALPITWWLSHPDAARVFGWAALYAVIGGLVEIIFQTERSTWRFASVREALALTRSVTVAVSVFLIAIFIMDRGVELPRSVPVVVWLISVLLLVGLRVAWRLRHDGNLLRHLVPPWLRSRVGGKTPLVFVGTIAAADRHIRAVLADPLSIYQPANIVTPNPAEVGIRLHGVRVRTTLDSWKAEKCDEVRQGDGPYAVLFLDDPVLTFGVSADRIGDLRRSGHILLRPQSMVELSGQSVPDLREITLEEFLPRKPVSMDPAALKDLIEGRRCLVTGAGGSIGAEITRQLLALGCSHLTMLDHSEFLLFEIDRELSNSRPEASRRAVLANVRDGRRIAEVFAEEKPDIVFHAAALKHVALVESNKDEGVLTNVLGTWNVIRASIESKAGQFVLISTDKAVSPTNMMGATKRVAEALLDLAPNDQTRLSAVRFGNVLGSAGSVVPIFRDQISRGGPVTVTHPDVDRYFMTIPEAVQLVLHSSAINAARQPTRPAKFLLEMGEPVKIVDLARQMITLSGKIPDVDIAITFTGLKAGEKLSEILSSDDEQVSPCSEGIMEISSSEKDDFLSVGETRKLMKALSKADAKQIAEVVEAVVADAARSAADARGV